MKKAYIRILIICAVIGMIGFISILTACKIKSDVSNESQDGDSTKWITAADSIDMDGMNLYWQNDNIYFSADINAKISLYVNAEKSEDGTFMFDDGQDWLLVMETSLGDYPLFPRKYVQLGRVSCAVFNDSNDISHVFVTIKQTAGYVLYDCVFDDCVKAFKVVPVYNAEDINFITSSE